MAEKPTGPSIPLHLKCSWEPSTVENKEKPIHPDEEPTRFHISAREETRQSERLSDGPPRIHRSDAESTSAAASGIAGEDRFDTTSYYILDARLGKGGFGVVYLATCIGWKICWKQQIRSLKPLIRRLRCCPTCRHPLVTFG